MFVDLHDGGLVAAAVAVVGRAEDGDHVLLVRPVVALHDQLVGPRHERQAVVVVELLGDVLPECVSCTTWVDSPATALIGVGPANTRDEPRTDTM